MANAKQKTVSTKPGTFKKGNTAALGNDKTLRISTWIERELEEFYKDPTDKYGAAMTASRLIAKKVVRQAITMPGDVALPYIREVLDRTEGKPQQKIDHTSKGEKITPILGGLVDSPTE